MQNKRTTGAAYETKAAAYLEGKGYRVLERNYHNRFGELDLILVSPDRCLVFCEVKYKKDNQFGSPVEAVTWKKRQHICRTAMGYMLEKRISTDCRFRFDVIGITGDQKIKHVENAFEFQM